MCAGDGFDECGFSVIYVTCCADDSHGFNLTTLCGQSEKNLRNFSGFPWSVVWLFLCSRGFLSVSHDALVGSHPFVDNVH